MIVDTAKAVRIEQEVARRGGPGLKRHGAELIGPCPRCGGTDRFGISIPKRLFNCRGCAAAGDVIAFVQHLDRCDFRTAVQILAGEMSDPNGKSFQTDHLPLERAKASDPNGQVGKTDHLPLERAKASDPAGEFPQTDHHPIKLANQSAIDDQNKKWSLRIWDGAGDWRSTVVENYFRNRGLQICSTTEVIRFHPACPFGKGRLPCMVALYRNVITNEPQAISRTALDAAGNKVGRMSLGPVRGGAIKVDSDTDVEEGLAVGEGLETILAARQLGFRPAWALGSAGAIRTFQVLPGITSLTIITDNDEPDQRGRQAGQEAATACSERWRAAGAEVRRVLPRATGADMADIAAQERGRRHG